MSPVEWTETRSADVPGTENRLSVSRVKKGIIPSGHHRDFRLGRLGADHLVLNVHGAGHAFVKTRDGQPVYDTPLPEEETTVFKDQNCHPPATVVSLSFTPDPNQDQPVTDVLTDMENYRRRFQAVAHRRDPLED